MINRKETKKKIKKYKGKIIPAIDWTKDLNLAWSLLNEMPNHVITLSSAIKPDDLALILCHKYLEWKSE